MTASDILLDTWGWWELMAATETGARLRARYLDDPSVRVHASALACGELAAKLANLGAREHAERAARAIEAAATMHPVTVDIATKAGLLRRELRERAPAASLADAIMLATAQQVGATLVSPDAAFRGIEGVVPD